MRFITIYPAAFLAVLATAAVADYPLSHNEQHRLAVFCSYVVATHEAIVGPNGGGTELKAGDTCPECRGAGQVGDGTVMMKCIYNEDGLYCKNGKLAAVGSANDSFGEDCTPERDKGEDCTPERDKLEKCMKCREKGFTEPQIRALGEQLLRAIEEARAKEQPPASDKPQPQPEPEQQPYRVSYSR